MLVAFFFSAFVGALLCSLVHYQLLVSGTVEITDWASRHMCILMCMHKPNKRINKLLHSAIRGQDLPWVPLNKGKKATTALMICASFNLIQRVVCRNFFFILPLGAPKSELYTHMALNEYKNVKIICVAEQSSEQSSKRFKM